MSASSLAVSHSQVSPQPVAVQNESPVSETEIFRFLTANSWFRTSGNDMFGSATTLLLKADGTYSWTVFSDYPEKEQSGRWNFKLRDDQSGVICFDDGDVIDFRKDGGKLIFQSREFTAKEKLEALGTRELLPRITPSDTYSAMVANAWNKTNKFELYRQADQIRFLDNGTIAASYRNGSCAHGGTWSLDDGDVTVMQDANFCDVRTTDLSQPFRYGYSTAIKDGLLFLDDTTYANSANPGENLFAFDAFGDIAVTGKYAGDLTKGKPATLEFVFENTDRSYRELGEFKLTLAKTGTNSNNPVEVFSNDFEGVRLEPGEKIHYTVTFTPAFAGETNLSFLLASKSSEQSYTDHTQYRTEIAE